MTLTRIWPLPRHVVEYIAAHSIFQALDETTWDSFVAELDMVRVPAGTLLFAQGDAGDSMYLIISGRFKVWVTGPDGGELVIDELEPGMTVGEMALLTGHPRSASVIALEDGELVRCEQSEFDHFCELCPEIARKFADSLAPRLMRADLASVLTNLFGPLDMKTIHDLQARMEWLHLTAGELLFRQGDSGDALYIVVTGRMQVVMERPDGSRRVITEIGRGECVGEFAVLTGDPRSATVYAERDSYLVKMPQAMFSELMQKYPQVMSQIARTVVKRARASAGASLVSSTVHSFAVIPAGDAVPLTAFARRLAEALSALGTTLHLSSEQCERLFGRPGIAQVSEDRPQNIALVGWLNEQLAKHQYIVYESDSSWSPWTERCLRHADRVLVVGQAGGDPELGMVELAARQTGSTVPTDLVLIHPAGAPRPSGTSAWLHRRDVHTHHHARLNNADDFGRLARRLTGRAFGLVFSGGGARGMAHIGAIRAFEELGMRPDFIGGTSAGAVAGASYAIDHSYEQLLQLARISSYRSKMLDYTLPMTSLIATRKFTNLYRELFGDVAIEDLWRPFFCISSNMTRAEPVVHVDGPVWKAVRASTAIPVIFAPLLDTNGDILIDGGVMNNFPIDVMREVFEAGVVVGVDVAPPTDDVRTYSFGPSVSGWQLLWNKITRSAQPLSAPSILESLLRTVELNGVYRLKSPSFREQADLLIQIPMKEYGMFDFDLYPEMIELGYQTVKQQIQRWEQPVFS